MQGALGAPSRRRIAIVTLATLVAVLVVAVVVTGIAWSHDAVGAPTEAGPAYAAAWVHSGS